METMWLLIMFAEFRRFLKLKEILVQNVRKRKREGARDSRRNCMLKNHRT